METCKFLENFRKFCEDFLFSEANLNQDYGTLDGCLKIFRNLNEIKKPGGRILRV